MNLHYYFCILITNKRENCRVVLVSCIEKKDKSNAIRICWKFRLGINSTVRAPQPPLSSLSRVNDPIPPTTGHSSFCLAVLPFVLASLLHVSMCHRLSRVALSQPPWHAETVSLSQFCCWKTKLSVHLGKDFKRCKCRLYLSSASLGWHQKDWPGKRSVWSLPWLSEAKFAVLKFCLSWFS